MPKCRKCDKKAIYIKKYAGTALCKEHFIIDFEKRVFRSIRKNKMIKRGEKIAVAVSGGKDSLSLLFFLNKYKERFGINICAVAVDEGIAGYRDKTLEKVKKFCKNFGIEYRIVSFKDKYGFSIDEVDKKHSCDYCGVFRRRALNEAALEIGANKIATAHNLDDEVQVILLNFIRADVNRFIRLKRKKKIIIDRIKPFYEIPEKEVALYAFLNNIDVSFDECPYVHGSFRYEIRKFINHLEEKSPGIKFSILRSYEKIVDLIGEKVEKEIKRCKKCGMPSSRDICKACELLSKINKINK